MKPFRKLTLAAMMMVATCAQAQKVEIRTACFQPGDNKEWSNPQFDDSQWKTIDVTRNWDKQGYAINNSYAWYRVRIVIPKTLIDASDLKQEVLLDMSQIDDVDEVYLNGKLVGKTGRMPGDEGGYASAWSLQRRYRVPLSAINWDTENVVAIRVYNGGEPGGIFGAPLYISVPSRIDGLQLTATDNKAGQCNVVVENESKTALSGELAIRVVDYETNEVISTVKKNVSPRNGKPATLRVPYDTHQQISIQSTFTDAKTGRSITSNYSPSYILTPAAPEAPRFNVPGLFGVRPGSPVIYRFPVSGVRPMKFTVDELPEGLSLDADKGVLSGQINHNAEIHLTVHATNAKGTATQEFTLKVGDNCMALTPPMGWNSWNCWGLSVTQDRVISSAQALIDKGLADYGYSYINIDDGWEAEKRNADGTIAVNEKFPSMKGLGDWLHGEGLKFGIYSSPGDYTCGGYLGSIDHELQDAESYNSWGIDYLKYDWCGYSRKHATERDRNTRASYVRPYLLMEGFLRQQPRDIFYSLCQYGMQDVWEWGAAIDANSWRTTGDITDTWESMYDLGFERNAPLYPYAQPGHWNDPDMLIVGKVGWGDNLRDSRLTPDEQYTHISLWSLQASNMLIGCDIAQMDDFTIGLLCNHEVNAINQDILGKQGSRVVLEGDLQIFVRELSDGSKAVGIFNVGNEELTTNLANYTKALEVSGIQLARDLWRQKDLDASKLTFRIPSHGCRLLKIK